MRRVIAFAMLAAAAGSVVPGAQAPSNQRPLVIRGGLLMDGTGSDPVPASVVAVANGRIQAVGREGAVAIPADALVIEAAGKTITPGLVDSHVHLRNYHIQDYLYWGVTTVGDIGNSPGWLTAYRDAVEQGRVAGSYILNGGNSSTRRCGPSSSTTSTHKRRAMPAMPSSPAPHLQSGRFARAKEVRQDAIKIRDRLTPAQMKMVVDIAHRQGVPVFAHFDSANTRQGQPFFRHGRNRRYRNRCPRPSFGLDREAACRMPSI